MAICTLGIILDSYVIVHNSDKQKLGQFFRNNTLFGLHDLL